MLVIEMLRQPAPLEDFVEAPQLRQTERGGEIAHAGLIRRRRRDHHRSTFVQPVRAVPAQRHGDIDIVGHHHAALAADQRRGLREIEHRDVAERADQRTFVFRADRFGGILDQHQIVLLRQRAQRRPGRWMTVVVAGDDGAGASR